MAETLLWRTLDATRQHTHKYLLLSILLSVFIAANLEETHRGSGYRWKSGLDVTKTGSRAITFLETLDWRPIRKQLRVKISKYSEAQTEESEKRKKSLEEGIYCNIIMQSYIFVNKPLYCNNRSFACFFVVVNLDKREVVWSKL